MSPNVTASTIDASLLEYVRAIYRDRRVTAAQAAYRLPLLRWWYHSAPLALACRQDNFFFHQLSHRTTDWSKWAEVVCNRSSGAVAAAVYLRKPMVTAAMSQHGFWLVDRGHVAGACLTQRDLKTDDGLRRRAQQQRAQHHPDNSWVEVLRVATSSCTSKEGRCEGGRAGCWFSKAVGSGIFLHTGRSLRAASRAQLAAALQLNASEAFGFYLRERRVRPGRHLPLDETEHILHMTHVARLRARPPPPLSKRELARGKRLFAANGIVLDYTVCEHARAAGFDTVQLSDPNCDDTICFPEMVSCHKGCADVPAGSVRGACAPSSVPLRTGWQATEPCRCNASVSVLNCHDSHPQAQQQIAPLPSALEVMGMRPAARPAHKNRSSPFSLHLNGGLNAFLQLRHCVPRNRVSGRPHT